MRLLALLTLSLAAPAFAQEDAGVATAVAPDAGLPDEVLGAAFEFTEQRTGGINFGFSLGVIYRF